MKADFSYTAIGTLAIALLLITTIGVYGLSNFFTAIPNINCVSDITDYDVIPTDITSQTTGAPNWNTGYYNDFGYIPRDSNGLYLKVNSSKSALYNNDLSSFSFVAGKNNNPQGIVSVDVLDNSNTLKQHLANFNATILTNSSTITYTLNGSASIPAVGDKIGISYNDNASNPTAIYTTSMNVSTGTPEFTADSLTQTIHGELVVSSSSALYHKDIDTLVIKIRKSGLPTGIIYAGVYNKTGYEVYSLGTKDISELSTTSYDIMFHNSTASYTLQIGDVIGLKYTGGDASNSLRIIADSTNPFDSTNSFYRRLLTSSGVWTNNTAHDMRAIITKVAYNSQSHYALSFDGVNDFIPLGTNKIIANQSSQITLAMWINPHNYNLQQIISNFQFTPQGWELYLDSNGVPNFRFGSAIDGSNRFITATYQLSKDNWHFLAFTYNGTRPIFYVDADRDRHDNTSFHSINIGGQMERIGNRESGLTELLYADLKDFHVYNRTLSESEIDSLRNGAEPSSTGLKVFYRFNEGTGSIVKDETGNHNVVVTSNGTQVNHPHVSTSIPNFVKIGITRVNQQANNLFDNTYRINDQYHGQKSTWIFGHNSVNIPSTEYSLDGHHILNHTTIQQLKNRGIQIIYLNAINATTAWNTNSNLWKKVILPFINEARDNGMIVAPVSLESVSFLDATTYTDARLNSTIQQIIDMYGQYFDRWVTDIEPQSLSNYTSNKPYYLDRIVHIHDVLGKKIHDNSKMYAPYIAYFQDNDIATLSSYPNGFDAINADYLIVSDYRFNSTLFNDAVFPIMTNRTIPATYILNLRYEKGSGKMDIEEYERSLALMDNYNKTHDNIVGISMYASNNVIVKSQTKYDKYTLTDVYKNSNYNDTQFFDLSYNFTQNTNNDDIQRAIDSNYTSFWRSASQGDDLDSEYIIVALNNSRYLDKIVINFPMLSAMPDEISIYVSNSNSSFGVPVAGHYELQRIEGNQTIDIDNRVAQYIKIVVSDNGISHHGNGFAIAEIIPQYAVVNQICDGDTTTNGATDLLFVIPMVGIGAISILILKREGII